MLEGTTAHPLAVLHRIRIPKRRFFRVTALQARRPPAAGPLGSRHRTPGGLRRRRRLPFGSGGSPVLRTGGRVVGRGARPGAALPAAAPGRRLLFCLPRMSAPRSLSSRFFLAPYLPALYGSPRAHGPLS